MKIKEILKDTNYQLNNGHSEILERALTQLTCDSRNVRPGAMFVAIKGTQADGHDFVKEALHEGAQVAIVDERETRRFSHEDQVILVEDTRKIFALLASRFFGAPSERVKLIGVTGTNGKTTTTHLLYHLYNRTSSCGLIGTIAHRIGADSILARNTTPNAQEINSLLKKMESQGIQYAAMEVSSHALDQERVASLRFHHAVFMNLTQDHLDYHGDLTTYFEAKKKLFVQEPRPGVAFVNADDPWSPWFFKNLDPKPLSFGVKGPADFRAENLECTLGDIRFDLERLGKKFSFRLPLIGDHNVYNTVAAIGSCYVEGMKLAEIQNALESFPGVPGRMERVDKGQDFYVFIDYAHTPDALDRVLGFLRPRVKRHLLTVFGCGGDRDHLKRSMMGQAAGRHSDLVWITSDNPRHEDPQTIISEICEGVPSERLGESVFCILDREEAIHQALTKARHGDVVVILGKGHEDYQIIGDKKIHFSDREVVERYLSA